MSPRARRSTSHTIRDHGTVRIVRGDRAARAPTEPEYRVLPCSPAPNLSVDEMAHQLAEDPEFAQWAFEEQHGVLY